MHAALPLLALATAATAVSVPGTLQTRQFGALGALVSGLSSPCIGNIAGLALSGDLSDCLGLSSALGIFTSLGSGDSLTPAIQGYLADNICPKDACSSSVLSDTKSKVASSCNSDDRASNNGVNLVTGLELIVNNYTQIRNIACLKQSNSNDYCVTDTLQLYEDQTKSNVTVSKLISLVSDPSSLISSLSNPTAFCTSCVDAISSVVFGTALGGPLMANSSDSTLKNGLVQGCGASYDDSSIPSDVSESFSNSTSSTTGSSSSSTPAPSSSSSQPANAAAPGLSMSAINFVAPVTLALGAIAGVLVVL